MTRKMKLVVAGAGAAAVVAGITRGICRKRFQTMPYCYGIRIKKTVTVNRSPEDLYCYWRRIENLQQLFPHVLAVKLIDNTRSSWTLRGPAGGELKWAAEITIDRENEMIGWRSVGRADLDNAGYIRFERTDGNAGTVVTVALQYNPPAGKLGAALAALMGERPEAELDQALQKFKELMEAGEVMRTRDKHRRTEDVDLASEESFPASDP